MRHHWRCGYERVRKISDTLRRRDPSRRRIFANADTLDAMISERPYRNGTSFTGSATRDCTVLGITV